MKQPSTTADMLCSPLFLLASAVMGGIVFTSWYLLLLISPLLGCLAVWRVRRAFHRLHEMIALGYSLDDIQADPLAEEAMDRLSTPLDRELATGREYYPSVFVVAAAGHLAIGSAVFAVKSFLT